RATSENLPSEQPDIALNLEICDQIRCKRLGAKEVCASIRKRLRHSNPNVQLLTLSLLDVCVKNGGNHFLVEVASREFMDDLVSILKQPAGINNQVKTKMLELIQVWAETFKGRPELSYTAQIYGALKAQGYDFPPKVEAIAAMIDTQTAPEWTDNDVCMRCRTAFTFTNRKHHCRNCGQIFCHICSNNKEALPQFGIPEPVRVCTGCYLKLRAASASTLSLSEFMASETPKMTPSEPAAPRLTSNSILAQSSDEMDEDLKRAIELSLQETKQDAPTKPKASAHPSSTATRVQESEEDADLAAAIAASLKDLKVREPCTGMYPDPSEIQSSRGRTTPDDPTQSYGQYQADIPNFSLTEKETQNILLFSKLVDSLKQSGDPIPDASVHNLYAELGNLGPKLSYSLKDTLLKHQIQHRLTSAIKLYDSQLERSAAISSKSNAYPPNYEVPLSHSVSSGLLLPLTAFSTPRYTPTLEAGRLRFRLTLSHLCFIPILRMYFQPFPALRLGPAAHIPLIRRPSLKVDPYSPLTCRRPSLRLCHIIPTVSHPNVKLLPHIQLMHRQPSTKRLNRILCLTHLSI
ncbi:Vacuolar protein-sorting-associated protein 27, partial [Massospora cicadina]